MSFEALTGVVRVVNLTASKEVAELLEARLQVHLHRFRAQFAAFALELGRQVVPELLAQAPLPDGPQKEHLDGAVVHVHETSPVGQAQERRFPAGRGRHPGDPTGRPRQCDRLLATSRRVQVDWGLANAWDHAAVVAQLRRKVQVWRFSGCNVRYNHITYVITEEEVTHEC